MGIVRYTVFVSQTQNIDSLTRSPLPDHLFCKSKEGKKEAAAWIVQQEREQKASSQEKLAA